MNPEKIELHDINKLFEYEKQCRLIDAMSLEELKVFSKLYCKLYLKQQEALISLSNLHK